MILLTALVVLATALFVLAPLLGWGAAPAFGDPAAASSGDEELLSRRQEILAGIRDLDMEYSVGKLTKEDYVQTRERLEREAIAIYRQMDGHARA